MIDHWKMFAEFCRKEKATGGPDPHLFYIAHASREESQLEKLWRGGCYVCPYTSPMAWVIWNNISWGLARSEPDKVYDWVRKNWRTAEGERKIVWRQERKCVGRPDDFARFLVEYALWVDRLDTEGRLPWRSYDEAWEQVNEIRNVGRYMAMKLLEYFYRVGVTRHQLHDLRPQGGWSPRKMLSILWPEYEGLLNDGKSRLDLKMVNAIAEETRDVLAVKYKVAVTPFELQVMLCEYREAFENFKQYPGRSHDIELGEFNRLTGLWGHEGLAGFLDAREAVAPKLCLGEFGTWEGTRDRLSKCVQHGYLWIDTEYSYEAAVLNGIEDEKSIKWKKGEAWAR